MNKLIVIMSVGLLVCWSSLGHSADIELPEIGDSAGALISPSQEYAIGQSFFWRLQQSVELIDDPEINSYLGQLGARLVAYSDAPNLAFTFFMIPEPSVNAFATPGGFIGIHSGLLLTSETEDEVASVLAHEIAHITQRHLLRSFEKSEQMSVPMTVAMIAAALLGVADPKMGSAAIMAVQAGGVQTQLNFTRAHESEADNLGMQTLVRAGFNPRAMPIFFERLQQSGRFYNTNATPEFLRTHPVTSSRIADARGRAETYTVEPHWRDAFQFYLMREKLRVMTSEDPAQTLAYYENALTAGNGPNEDAIRYGYSLALLAQGHYIRAREMLQPLIDKDDERLSYQLALANIEIAIGRIPAALSIYEMNQALYPDDEALTLEQVSALLQAKRPEQASILLQRQLDLGATSRRLYKLLARAKGDMGDMSQSHVWLAEYYYVSGRLKPAIDQLHLAAEFAKGNEYQLAKISARLREVEMTLAQMEQH